LAVAIFYIRIIHEEKEKQNEENKGGSFKALIIA
jgi:hypothetical protein